jgi:NTP pyrophosphatase (non-canonical NTP hydrolase)
MNDKQKEVMLIAQEECAEVIQAISKVFRFGMDDVHPTTMKSNKDSLEEEVGDLMCMIELMQEYGIISATNVLNANVKKRNKLKQWSNIFEDVNYMN